MKRLRLFIALLVVALLLGVWGLSRSRRPSASAPREPGVASAPTEGNGETGADAAGADAAAPAPEPAAATATVVGELVRTDDGERVRDARVRLAVSGSGIPYRTIDLEAKDGTFRADGLPAGAALQVQVAAEGLRPEIEDRAPLPDPDGDARYRTALRLVPGENRLTVPTRPAVPLRVTVVDGDGAPLAGRIVVVDDCVGWLVYAAAAPTGEDGTVSFGVPEGDGIHVRVEQGGSGERDYRIFERVDGEALEATLVLQYPDTGVEGRVVDASGAPVAGAGVSVVARDRDIEGWSATDETGRFASGGFAPGKYRLVAFRTGYPPRVVPLVAVEGETVHVDVAFEEARTIAGRIFRRDGTPAAGVGVRADVVLPVLNYIRRSEDGPRTDEEGRFVLEGLPEGSYDLNGFLRFEDGRSTDFDLAKDVPTGTTDLRCVLPWEYLTVRGRVAMAGRAPDRPFAVVFFDEDGGRHGPSEFATADGRFTLSSFRAGDYRAVAYAEGYAPSAPVPVHVEAGEPAPEIVLALRDPEAVVTVRVRDEAGRPIRGPRVLLDLAGRPAGLDTRYDNLDPDGRVVLARLPAGPGELVLGEGETELELAAVEPAAGDRLDVDVVLRVRPVVDEVWDDDSPFREGDVILAVAGKPVENSSDAESAFQDADPNAPLAVTLERSGARVTRTLPPIPGGYLPALRDDYTLVRATVRP